MSKRMIPRAAVAVLLLAVPAGAQQPADRPAATAGAQQPADRPAATAEQELLAASKAVAQAQTGFDLEALEALLAPDYVEVSPVGDVDERAEVLGFYTPEAKAAMLESGVEPLSVTVVEPRVRLYGDIGIVVARQDAELEVDGAVETRGLRVTQVFRKIDDRWLLQSAHFTSIKAQH